MKKFLLLCALCASVASAQTTTTGNSALQAQLFLKNSTVGRSVVFVDTRASGVTNHVFVYNVQGGPATCTLLIERSDDAVTWITEATETCTTNSQKSIATVANFYTVNLSALTGGTSPNVTVNYRGYLPGQGIPVRPAEGGTGTTTVFTAGSVPIAGASGVYEQDNSNFFFDNANNRLCLLGNTCTNTFEIGAGKFFVTAAGAATAVAGVTAKADAAGNVAQTTQGFTGQTADLQQMKNSAATVLGSTSAAGIVKGNRLDNNVILSGTVKADPVLVTVANTTTETNLNTYVVPLNTLVVGRTIRVTATGLYSTANGTDTFTLRAKQNAATLQSVTSTATTVTGVTWMIEWLLVNASTGAGGTWQTSIPLSHINSVLKTNGGGVGAVDTTANNTLALSVQWSAAAAGNTISIHQFIVEVLN